MTENGTEWKDFRELVTWATWEVIRGITSGEKLESVMFGVVRVAREAKFKGDSK